MNMTKTSAITDPVQTGNHPMKVNNRTEKKVETGITVTAPCPLVAIMEVIRIPIVTIRADMIPASVVVVFMKSATFDRYWLQTTILIQERKRG